MGEKVEEFMIDGSWPEMFMDDSSRAKKIA